MILLQCKYNIIREDENMKTAYIITLKSPYGVMSKHATYNKVLAEQFKAEHENIIDEHVLGTGRKWQGNIKIVKNYKLPNEANNDVIWLLTI